MRRSAPRYFQTLSTPHRIDDGQMFTFLWQP